MIPVKTSRMKKVISNPGLRHTHEGADPSVNVRDLIISKEETNTSEGCEYIDNNFRMKEQRDQDEGATKKASLQNNPKQLPGIFFLTIKIK